MNLEEVKNLDEFICFLIVNNIPKIHSLAVGSSLLVTECSDVIGYANEADLRDIPTFGGIVRFDLRKLPITIQSYKILKMTNTSHSDFQISLN